MARKKARITGDQAKILTDSSEIADILSLGDDASQLPAVYIPTERIEPNPYQTRRHFSEEGLRELVTSMRANGFLGILVAREKNGVYEIAFGERRLRAAKVAGIQEIPLHVRDFSDLTMAEVGVAENVIRQDLLPIEEAEGYKILYDEFNYSYTDISNRVGASRSRVIRIMALLKDDDIKEAVQNKDIRPSVATELLRIDDKDERNALLEKATRNKMNRDRVRTAVDTRLIQIKTADTQPSTVRKAPASYDPVPYLENALNTIKSIPQKRLSEIDEGRLGDAVDLIDKLQSTLDRIRGKMS